MKFQLSAALMGLAATVVSAQDKQLGPFSLHIKGTNPNSEIDGYGWSCHAGAGISGLCYAAIDQPYRRAEIQNPFKYFFNYTGFNQVGNDEVGTLVWNQPYTDPDGNPASASQPMDLVYQPTSNVAALLFGFSDAFLIGFDSEDGLFGYNYVDDSTYAPGKPPSDYSGKAYYRWAVCWQYFTGYFYQSVAWVQLGAPHNPTCEPVEITKINA